mgnify:CR=1 FL=1
MDSFIERFCAKYYFPYAEGRQLIEGMEYKTDDSAESVPCVAL